LLGTAEAAPTITDIPSACCGVVHFVIVAGIVQQRYGSDLALGILFCHSLIYCCEITAKNRKSDVVNLLGIASSCDRRYFAF